MSEANGHGRGAGPHKDPGVLVNLPSTRPQRATPRRAAARRNAEAARGVEDAGARPPGRDKRQTPNGALSGAHARSAGRAAGERQGSPGAGRRRVADTGAPRERAPRQGFESESEAMTGSVRPPGALELAVSAAELVGEAAKAGLSTGERLLKDVFSRLPH